MPATSFHCLVCEHEQGRILFDKEGVDYAQCRACGFVQQHPVPSEADAAAMYEPGASYGEDLLKGGAMFLDRDRELIAELAGHGAEGPLLDVGAGAGLILQAARERGWDGTGIEISGPDAQAIRERVGAEVHEVPIGSAPLPAAHFGVVTMSHSLEHFVDPVASLRRAAEVLRPGGLLHVAVPNWRAAKRSLGGKHVCWIYNHHITYFQQANLHAALRKAGFEPVDSSVRNYPGRDYRFVIAVCQRFRLDRLIQRWLVMGDRPPESLLTDNVQIGAPPWRLRALMKAIHAFLWLWPERLWRRLGRGDELRVTARRV